MGWDQIPGARGCTPQSCSFRDHYQELQALGAEVVGLSVQSTEYQKEMADRLHLPFPVVSDVNYQFQKALNMPTFVAAGMTLLKRITLIANNGVIEAVHYPIFPSDSDPSWVIDYLNSHKGLLILGPGRFRPSGLEPETCRLTVSGSVALRPRC